MNRPLFLAQCWQDASLAAPPADPGKNDLVVNPENVAATRCPPSGDNLQRETKATSAGRSSVFDEPFSGPDP
jgi:hypothetical protein